tara:strand:+ start:230 stop:391 length:162 start_codon:yes stop_codon:yes gene_type:complete
MKNASNILVYILVILSVIGFTNALVNNLLIEKVVYGAALAIYILILNLIHNEK